jgi:hypothetical protein
MASSTTARATDALCGSTPIKTFMSARTSVSVGPSPSARAKDIPTSCRAHTHTSFESLRASGAGEAQAENKPTLLLRATGSSRAIPVVPAP